MKKEAAPAKVRAHPYRALQISALGTFGLRVVRGGLGFITSLILARLLGPQDFGAYSVALAIGWLLAGVAVVGTQQLLIREIAVARAQARWDRLQGVLRWTSRVVWLSAIALCGVAAAVAATLGDRLDPLILNSLWPALLLVPLGAQIARRQGAMQGLEQLITGQVPELLVQPLLMLGLIAVADTLAREGLTASLAVWLRVFAAAVALWLGHRLLKHALPRVALGAHPVEGRRGWRRACAGFLVLSVTPLLVAQAPVAMLGSIRGAEEAGIFAITLALAEILQFVTLAVSSALAPRIAACHARAALDPMQDLLVKGARTLLLICVAMAALGIAYGDSLLALLGEPYRQGAHALGILVGSYAFLALLGLPGLVLTMTHQESVAALWNGLSVLATIILCLALIPGYGMSGAAMATAGGLLIRQVLLALTVRGRIPVAFTPWTSTRWERRDNPR